MIDVRCSLTALTLALSSTASAQLWTPLDASNGSAAVVAVHPLDPRVLALTWDNRVSFDGGLTWDFLGERVREGRELAFDPSDPTVWYLITWGDADDPGKELVRITWRSGPTVEVVADRTTFDGGIPSVVTVHPNDSRVIYVGTSRGALFRSEDHGVSWRLLLAAGSADREDHGHPLTRILLASPSVFVVDNPIDRATFYRSTDAGVTWQPGGTNLGGRILNLLAVLPEDPDVMYVSAGTYRVEDPRTQVLQSSDGGSTWRKLLEVRGVRSFAVDRNAPQRLAVGVRPLGGVVGAASCSVFISENGGDSWSDISITPSGAIPYIDCPRSLAFAGDSRLLASTKLGLLALQLPLEGTSVQAESWARVKSGFR